MAAREFFRNTLDGLLGPGAAATFYRLDPFGRVPISRIGQVIRPQSSDALSLDMVETEQGETRGEFSTHTFEDYGEVATGFRLAPEGRTISGLISATVPVPLVGGVGGGEILARLESIYGLGTRPDLVTLANLRAMQRRGEPVAVVTPRWSHSRMVIASIADTWAPGQGEAVRCTVVLAQARVVSPLVADGVIPDPGTLFGGNRAQGDAGQGPSRVAEVQATGGGSVAAPILAGII